MDEDKSVVMSLRITPTLKAMVDAAAKRSGLGLNDWLRAVMALAANQGAFAPKGRGTRRGRER